jgi:hypothetical protein
MREKLSSHAYYISIARHSAGFGSASADIFETAKHGKTKAAAHHKYGSFYIAVIHPGLCQLALPVPTISSRKRVKIVNHQKTST